MDTSDTDTLGMDTSDEYPLGVDQKDVGTETPEPFTRSMIQEQLDAQKAQKQLLQSEVEEVRSQVSKLKHDIESLQDEEKKLGISVHTDFVRVRNKIISTGIRSGFAEILQK